MVWLGRVGPPISAVMAGNPSSAPPQLALRGFSIGFGGEPLLADADLALLPGERACLVGRNGSGKSTLLKALAGLIEPDAGERYVEPGLKVGYLPQDPVLPKRLLVADYVAGSDRPERAPAHDVAAVLHRLDLDGGRVVDGLSGGEARRAALAQAIVTAPDVLLLDEPTNHLDLPTILWLEAMLTASRTTMLMISHDQAFLRATTQRIFWVRRGQVLSHPRGYGGFEAWADEVQAEEDNRQAKINQHIKAETHWLIHGVTARRRRNQGRLQRLDLLRAERKTLLSGGGKAAISAASGQQSGKLVIEAKDLHKSFDGLVVVDGFSTRIARGERIGLIGPNGAGKTTLLNMLTGRLEADRGSLRLGTKLDIAVFDQKRQALDPNATLWRTLVEGGGDSLMVHGRQKHVVAYLRDFLFDDRQAQAPVHTLSGGERNRLLLAKILARPSNLLVLDEPTNDLDADTLALLQDMLDKYDGTLLLVSHDRDFLDHVVHSTIVLEGDGIIQEYAGGYSDYLKQRGNGKTARGRAGEKAQAVAAKNSKQTSEPRKLSFQENRELAGLPDRIEALSAARDDLEAALARPEVYVKDPEGAGDLAAKLKEITHSLAAAEDRWLTLEALQETLVGSKPS